MVTEKENNLLMVSIRLFVAIGIVSFGVLRHLFGLEESSGALLESGLAGSSQGALILIHLLTLLEFGFVVWTLTGKLTKYYSVLFGVIFIIYTLSFFLSIGNERYLNASLTSLSEGFWGYPIAVMILLFVILTQVKLGKIKPITPNWVSIVLVIGLWSGYGAYYYPSTDQFLDRGNVYEVKYAKWDRYWELLEESYPEFLDEKNYKVCFFNTSCSHCNDAASRIGVYQKKNPEIKLLAVFFAQSKDVAFWETNDRVEEFLSLNKLDVPFLKMKDYEAVSISSNQFPVIVEMQEKEPVSLYIGGELNAWAFDHLFANP